MLMVFDAVVFANQPEFRLAPWPHQVATPRFELQDADGHPRTVASYAGTVVVVYFGFLSCPDQCPTTLFKLAQVMKALGPTRRPVTVLFVTLDPEHDSPQALKLYVRGFDPRFIALTGSSAAVNRAAAAFFVQHARITQAGRETIDHSTGLFLLDTHGQLRVIGSTQSTTEDLVHDLRLLAAQ
jgi:protein SCO1/2